MALCIERHNKSEVVPIRFEISLSNTNNYKVVDDISYDDIDYSKLEALFDGDGGTKVISWNGTAWELDGETINPATDCGLALVEEYDYDPDSGDSTNLNRYDTITIGGVFMAAATAPISTYKTYLMYKATSAATQYTKLIDIKNFPDLGGEPERRR